jgi:hypothetical protein
VGQYSTVYCMLSMCESGDIVYSMHTKKRVTTVHYHSSKLGEKIDTSNTSTFLERNERRIRETRKGWPLLTVETVVKGDLKSTNERVSSLVGSLGLIVPVQETFVLPWLL